MKILFGAAAIAAALAFAPPAGAQDASGSMGAQTNATTGPQGGGMAAHTDAMASGGMQKNKKKMGGSAMAHGSMSHSVMAHGSMAAPGAGGAMSAPASGGGATKTTGQ